jgi:hypothetical protein
MALCVSLSGSNTVIASGESLSDCTGYVLFDSVDYQLYVEQQNGFLGLPEMNLAETSVIITAYVLFIATCVGWRKLRSLAK